MQMPFHNVYYNHRFPPPNRYQCGPNFVPRGLPSRFRAPAPHWRQPLPHDHGNEFWCETCDRGFRSLDILENHKQQHQKCNIDGCQYIAHPKVITKHIQMQHASGLYKKIAKLQDPEEIKKWREERKKKYPTKENVEKAAAAIKEKIERGEKMGLKNNRHEKNLKNGAGIDGKKQHSNKRNNRTFQNYNSAPDSKRRKVIPKNTNQKLPTAEDSRKLKPFAGIQELILETDEPQDEAECDFSIEDEDELPGIPSEASSGSVCHALSSLMCNYGSSDEDESESILPSVNNSNNVLKTDVKPPTPTPTLNQTAERKETDPIKKTEKQVSSQTTNGSDDDSGPEELKVTKPDETENKEIETKPVVNKRKPKDNILQKPVLKRPKPKLPSTLLQKLLSKEMKHERNIVLQCIRHIIRNNFYDKSTK